MKHPEYEGEVRVGCDCASKMTEDYVNPRETEKDYKNKINRKKNFLRQEWIYKRETGNYTLQYKGERITIMKSKYGSEWGIMFRNMPTWRYQGEQIRDLETAKLVAFEIFDKSY